MPRFERNRAHGFVFYPDDYLNDPAVRRMGVMGRGAYGGSLLPALWNQPEPGVVEDDDELLASLAMCTLDEWGQVRERVARAFDTTSRPGYWIQKRMVEQHRAYDTEYRRKKRAGTVAAKSRWSNDEHATRIDVACDSHTTAILSEERGTRNEEPLPARSQPPARVREAVPPQPRLAGGWPEALSAAFGEPLLDRMQARYPDRDVAAIAEKCLEKSSRPVRALPGFVKQAELNDWDRKPPRLLFGTPDDPDPSTRTA